jgi:hypothetical protein
LAAEAVIERHGDCRAVDSSVADKGDRLRVGDEVVVGLEVEEKLPQRRAIVASDGVEA